MADTLIRSANIVSMDDTVDDLPRGDILVRDDRIVEIGAQIDAPEGAEIVEAEGMIAMPGFVNAHIHTWQTPLRGIAADWTLGQYLRAMHAGLAGFFKPEDISTGNYFGAINQIASGTTTLVDWCHNNPAPDHTDAAIDGLMDSGIRAVFLHGSPKPDPKPGQKHFSEVPMPKGEVERLRNGRLSSDDALVTMGLAVLGPQLAVWDVCEEDFQLARETGLRASMHISGAMRTPDGLERLAALGLLGPQVNIVHGNILTDDQLHMLSDLGVTFTLTPEVELQMGFGDPLTARLRKIGGRISIGSDIESAMAGDMFAVTRFALQAARHYDNLEAIRETGASPPEMTIPTREALSWATIEGARMVGLDDRIGSLTPGKQADIVLLDATKPNMFPPLEPVASILFHAGVGNVDSVMIAGTFRKRGGELCDLPARRDPAILARTGERILSEFNRAQSAHG
ncbi:MAG: amidohydrolase family protein [Hyphomicrobiaceae bacterium]|nr:amidohydrolase family protein [Hyphomicrobiaceae bacterium]MCC0025303.1 amidohydrolase family protein [Hyphomicrobiaceae bacterium]